MIIAVSGALILVASLYGEKLLKILRKKKQGHEIAR